MEKIMIDIKRLKHKIERTQNKVDRLKEYHGKTPVKDFTYHGGWNLGYLEGMLRVMEDILDERR